MSLLLKILYKRALNLSHVSQSSNPSLPMPLITKVTPRILPNSPIRPSSATLMLDTLSVLTVTDNPPQTTYNIRDPGVPSSNTFEELVQDLSIALGPTSGLDSDDVDPLNIQRLMERYTSNQDDWLRFALGDSTRSYTRNLIDEGNGKSNLLILVWNPGRGSAVHDHANAHCVMKVLKGTLRETLYTWPDQERIEHGQVSPPQVKKVTTYGENQVTYMSDKLGLHKIHNPDPNDVAISLHLYTPPNAANYGVSIFDEKSGKACHIKQSNFYSIRGKRA